MTQQLIRQAQEIRAQAAQLLLRAEKLLEDMRQIKKISYPTISEEKTPGHGRVIHQLR